MDPYEILGIRPNAGRDEIELAYKGRRSQYHPDRYAQADAETQAWATGKMKEINQAYAVVTNEAERDRFDQEQFRRATPKESPPPPPPPPPMTLRQVLHGYTCATEPFQRIFIAPHIPANKMAGAIKSYGEGVRPQDVVALVDDTVFGGAKEGMLITESEIYFKAIFEPVSRLRLDVVKEISAHGNVVHANDFQFAKLNIPEKRDVKALFKRIDSYIKSRSVESPHRDGKGPDHHSSAEGLGRAEEDKLYARLKQGFFSRLEADVRREAAVADSPEEWVVAELIRQLMHVSGVLDRFVQQRGIPLSRMEKSFLASDPMRWEVLTFVMPVVDRLLSDEAGMDEEQVQAFTGPAMLRVLMAYVAEVEDVGRRRTLRSVARPFEELEESRFFMDFRRRCRRYGVVLGDSPGNVVEAFSHSMSNPAAFYALDEPQRRKWGEFAQGFMGRVLDPDGTPVLLGRIFEETEAALVNVLDRN